MENCAYFELSSSSFRLENVPLYVGGIVVLLIVIVLSQIQYKVFLQCLFPSIKEMQVVMYPYGICFYELLECTDPGPKYAIATGLIYRFVCVEGDEAIWTCEMHEEYSEIIRLMPDRLSYINPMESLTSGYIAKLVEHITGEVATDPAVHLDIVKLCNCTIFDMMADLTFSEPLGMLETSEYTPWVKAVFGASSSFRLPA
ncbi:hypothetical protein GQ44DRAFT_731999 [Phaeosphaeriaceae sp. PMI808]|nr:hypothetical protein GQ44DRAFT_731999 [Phaeosphaeriaceae sp. PMI808]